MVFVGIGGIFGAISRFLLGKWASNKLPGSPFYGTWFINISGSFVLGFLSVLHTEDVIPDWFWLLIGTGFIGAYTTFSTFGYETIQMLTEKENRRALVYVSTSVSIGIFFAWIGWLIGYFVF